MSLCKLCAEEPINVKDRRSLASQKSEGVRALLEEALIQQGRIAKHKDFPLPVGRATNTSFPPANAETASACSGRRVEYPSLSQMFANTVFSSISDPANSSASAMLQSSKNK